MSELLSETYQHQNEIPPLPVPGLVDTTELFLRCLKPLADDDSYKRTSAVCAEFLKNEGPVLHTRLLEYAAEKRPESWLMPYWLDSYLYMRKPITIEGNFIFELSPLGLLEDYGYLEFTAAVAHSIGLVFKELADGTLPPMFARDTPLCMKQFEGALRGTKIPCAKKDEFRIYEYEEIDSFGVFYKNRYYAVKLIDGSNVVSAEKILSALRDIYSEKNTREINFNTAGFAGSDKAARIIEKICGIKENAEAFDIVNKAMFNIALSDVSSTEITSADKLYLGAEDAWPYKPWNITVFQDKICCFNIEHTYLDGLTNMHLIERMIGKMKEFGAGGGLNGEAHDILRPVNFKLDDVALELSEIKKEYLNEVSQFGSAVYLRGGISAKTLKERKVSVDFYLQLAYQYAQLAAFGEARCTHESVSATQYYEGRTSELRTVSEESIAFVNALSRDVSGNELSELLSKASAEHSERVTAAKNFRSFLRLAAGLKDMCERFGAELGLSGTPEIFEDANYIRYATQEISTSTVGNTWYVNHFAFAPQTERGLGIGYVTHGGDFIANISFYKDEAATFEKFKNGLDEFFDKMNDFLL